MITARFYCPVWPVSPRAELLFSFIMTSSWRGVTPCQTLLLCRERIVSYFSGMRALITGAGTGIGALMARELAQRGADVLVSARRLEAANAIVDEIRAAGGKASAVVLDVASNDSILAAREEILRGGESLDLLINNAGVVFGGAFEQVPLEQHLNTFQINTLGVMACCHAFFDMLCLSPRAHVINIASASAFIGLPFGTSYAASKWAVVGFSESLRLELKERGIDNVAVTTVCPTYISTGMFDGARAPLLTPMLTPEKVVRETLRAAQHRDPMLYLPLSVKSADLLKGLLPRPLFDEVAKRTGVSGSMKHWHGKS